MTIYRTVVVHLPATPLGLLPGRWMVEHHCGHCHQRVTAELLVAHAQDHDAHGNGAGGESFQSRETSATLAPDRPGPSEETVRAPGSR